MQKLRLGRAERLLSIFVRLRKKRCPLLGAAQKFLLMLREALKSDCLKQSHTLALTLRHIRVQVEPLIALVFI